MHELSRNENVVTISKKVAEQFFDSVLLLARLLARNPLRHVFDKIVILCVRVWVFNRNWIKGRWFISSLLDFLLPSSFVQQSLLLMKPIWKALHIVLSKRNLYHIRHCLVLISFCLADIVSLSNVLPFSFVFCFLLALYFCSCVCWIAMFIRSCVFRLCVIYFSGPSTN